MYLQSIDVAYVLGADKHLAECKISRVVSEQDAEAIGEQLKQKFIDSFKLQLSRG